MLYNLNNQLERKQAETYFDKLMEHNRNIELKAIQLNRTISQNSYLHVVISLYAIEFGYTLNEAKTDLKRACDFMIYEKDSKKYLKETHKMDVQEVGEFISWIRTYAGLHGLYIPTADEYKQNKFNIDKEINKNKTYI